MNACCWVLQLDHLMGTFSCMLLKFEMKLKLFTKWCTFFHINTIDGVYAVSLLCFIVYDMNCGCSDTAVWLSLLEFLNLFLQYSFEYLFIQLWQHIYFDFVTECEYWQTHNRKKNSNLLLFHYYLCLYGSNSVICFIFRYTLYQCTFTYGFKWS